MGAGRSKAERRGRKGGGIPGSSTPVSSAFRYAISSTADIRLGRSDAGASSAGAVAPADVPSAFSLAISAAASGTTCHITKKGEMVRRREGEEDGGEQGKVRGGGREHERR